jgi:hypothetical protein
MSNLVELYNRTIKFDDIYNGMLLRIKANRPNSLLKVGDVVEVTYKERRCSVVIPCRECTCKGHIISFIHRNDTVRGYSSHSTCYYEVTDISGRDIKYE